MVVLGQALNKLSDLAVICYLMANDSSQQILNNPQTNEV